MILLPSTNKRVVVNVTIPSPPNWIKNRMTAWPNRLQCSAMDTVESPVTQIEVVAVKSASTKGVTVRSFVAIGSERSMVPRTIAARKPSIIILVVVITINLFFFFIELPRISNFSCIFVCGHIINFFSADCKLKSCHGQNPQQLAVYPYAAIAACQMGLASHLTLIG